MDRELKRLTPNTATIRRLLLRSGNECAFPGCNHVIFNDDDTLVAECCHIEAALKGGERFNELQTPEQRRAYENLLFLCKQHHVETDDVNRYDVAALKKIKTDHEARFRGRSFAVKPGYTDQVLDSLHQILDLVKDTAERVRRIDENLLNALNKNLADEVEPEPSLQYFGCPEVTGFKGRVKELGEWYREFAMNRTFFIGGISGIGKSTLIAQFVAENKQYKPLWIDCEVIQTKALFYDFFAAFVRQEFGNKTIASILKTTDENLINRTVSGFLREHACCLIFDGLNEYIGEFEPILKLLNEFLMLSKVIISSKFNIDTTYWKNPVFKIALSGLDEDSFGRLLGNYHGLNIRSGQVSQLHRLLNGHPYLLKLTASVLQYQPAERFIAQLTARNSAEINEFIQQKALELLDAAELSLIKKIAAFQVPFRYELGDFINEDNFDRLFRSLKDKFLIEVFQKQFFIVPEFIRTHIFTGIAAEENEAELFADFVRYLRSVKSDPRIFEKNALVYHALHANMDDLAREQAMSVLSALMGTGEFNMVLSIADQMAAVEKMASWWFIFYVQGRVFRFLNNFESALARYDHCFQCVMTNNETENVQFERASVMTLIAKETENPELMAEAKATYEGLTTSEDVSRALQSEISLATMQMHMGKYPEALRRLLAFAEKVTSAGVYANVQAGYWQMVGDAYSKMEQYKEAFEAFDKSCDLYEVAIEKFGMNTIDGLFQLYNSYGWTFAKVGDYNGATEMFACCLGLSDRYGLGLKKENALFNYGYHLFMNWEFENAADVLTLHYKFIREQEMMDELDMPFVYGVLASSHWYSGDMLNAVELMGIYILESIQAHRRPMVSMVEADSLLEEIDFVELFNKKVYIFIIPAGKSFADFKECAAKVIENKPFLAGPLNDFTLMQQDQE